MFSISHKTHNKLVKTAASFFPITYHDDEPESQGHPWFVDSFYEKDKDGKSFWRARVDPGLVNGFVPYMTTEFRRAEPAAQERIEAEAREKKNKKPTGDDLVSVYLDENPSLKLQFRSAIPGAPEFFKKLGCTDPVPNRAGDLDATNTRLLKSCDLVLVQPRPSLTNNVGLQPFGSGTLITSTPGLFVPANREPFVIAITQFIPKPTAPATFKSVFFNTFEDTGRDELHLARVFLLSPPLPLRDPENLSTWQPFVQYKCHYNLVYMTKRFPKAKTNYEKPLILQTGLAFGLADSIFNQLLTGGQNLSTNMLAHLKERELSGKFYNI